jgi:putative sterol carrier protein
MTVSDINLGSVGSRSDIPPESVNSPAHMPVEAFSEQWALEWCRILNERAAYRAAAASWEGPIALAMTRSGAARAEQRAVFLDLWHGECRAARRATDEDLEAARFVITGTASAWRELLAGNLAPLTAIMSGKIRLTRGSMAALVPYAAAARELVAAALDMDVEFPGDW